jgi:hypothetical protein
LVGSSRTQGTKLRDDAPSLSINVGAHFYAQRPELASLGKASVKGGDKGHLDLQFVYRGSSVRISGDGLSRAELMAVAKSLVSYDLKDWRKRLGARLLTQDPSD